MTINLKAPELRELKPHIMVAGIGGAAAMRNNMIVSGLLGSSSSLQYGRAGADLVEIRADYPDGPSGHRGLGAGSQPEVAGPAEEAIEEIRDHFPERIWCSSPLDGRRNGTGAAPVIAARRKGYGILTVGVVTKPFQFEGARRMRIAEAGINELQNRRTLIIIPIRICFVSPMRRPLSQMLSRWPIRCSIRALLASPI